MFSAKGCVLSKQVVNLTSISEVQSRENHFELWTVPAAPHPGKRMPANEEGRGATDGKRRRRGAGAGAGADGKDEDAEDSKGKRAKKAVQRGGAAARGKRRRSGRALRGWQDGGLGAAGCRSRTRRRRRTRSCIRRAYPRVHGTASERDHPGSSAHTIC